MNKKRFLINGMVALAIMLFISMYLVGKRLEEPNLTTINEQQPPKMTTANSEKEIDEHDHEHAMENHAVMTIEDVENNIRPESEAPPEEIPFTLTDLYDAQTIEVSKETALQFVNALFSFDGDHPQQHIEQASPYMSETLAEQAMQSIGRATNEMYKATLKQLEIAEAYDQKPDYLVWLVYADGDFYSNTNELTSHVEYEYTVVVQEVNNQMKVMHYQLRKLGS